MLAGFSVFAWHTNWLLNTFIYSTCFNWKKKKKNVVDRLMFISFVKEFRQLIAALGKRQKKELYVTAVRSSLLVTGEGWRRILSVLVLHGRVEQTVCLVNFWKNNHNHYDSNNLSVGGKKKKLARGSRPPFFSPHKTWLMRLLVP